ncbi:MAG: DUF4123 domain-containing protein [Gammaproteobacteria bacterium]
MQDPAIIASVRRELFADRDEKVYAALDGASIGNLLDTLSRLGQDSLCLFRGELDPRLEAVAPHLVWLDADAPFTDFVLSGWGRHWGIFALADAEPDVVHRHFRKHQMVELPDGNPYLFRYYDPRVLREYLATCPADAARPMFGPVVEYVAEGKNPGELIRYTFADGSLGIRTLPLTE